MTSHDVPGPLGFRFREEDGAWDVLVKAGFRRAIARLAELAERGVATV